MQLGASCIRLMRNGPVKLDDDGELLLPPQYEELPGVMLDRVRLRQIVVLQQSSEPLLGFVSTCVHRTSVIDNR